MLSGSRGDAARNTQTGERGMTNKGFSHLGLSTLDLDKTRDFYENILGFKAVRCDIIKVKEGGQIRHIFFDTGRDQLMAFMEARGVPGVPAHYDAGITRGLGVPSAFYHFAFETGSEAGLVEKRRELIAKGVEVTDVVDHDWAKSIYFKDPNGLQLEFCCFTRSLNANDARMQDRFEMSVRRLGLDDPDALSDAGRGSAQADLDLLVKAPGA
jgi:catechol 2,3-dioxygenase-like lactoylglutathione lyase family enzyme